MTTTTYSFIGQWAQRNGTKAHIVESEIGDRLVMRCGRQMKLMTEEGELVVLPISLLSNPCSQCTGPRMGGNGADA